MVGGYGGCFAQNRLDARQGTHWAGGGKAAPPQTVRMLGKEHAQWEVSDCSAANYQKARMGEGFFARNWLLITEGSDSVGGGEATPPQNV